MNAVALSPALAYAIVVATALLIVLLHLLRPRAMQRAVSSTVLWMQVLRQRRRYYPPWRWLLSLVLCLAIGIALALALGRPDGFSGAQSRLVIVLDNSASMATRTRDGQSRWQHALTTARDLIESVNADVMLVDTMGQAPVTGFAPPAQALDSLARFEVVSAGSVRSPVLADADDVVVHVISDGVAAFDFPDSARVHSVFEPAINVAVTGLKTRAMMTDPLRVEAFVQVYNASPQARPVRLTLRGGDRFSLAQDLHMQPGELIDATFDISGFDAGVLAAAAISAGDAYALDDIAYDLVQPHRRVSLMLVTAGNARLEDALRSLPGVQIQIASPEQWNTLAPADAYVFDRYAPDRLPARGALLFRPDKTPWLAAARTDARSPPISDWRRGHDLLDGVAWDDVKIGQALLMTELSADAQTLVNTAQGALVAASDGEARWVIAGFSPEDTNMSLRPALPVFLGHVLRWLTEVEPVLTVAPGSVRVPLADARVVSGDGTELEARPIAESTLFDAPRPDIYTAWSGKKKLRIVVSISDPRDADINVSRFDQHGSRDSGIAVAARTEPWVALAALALLLLLIEWAAWTRRAVA